MNITLGELVDFLGEQPADKKVKGGFGAPHTDRGSYYDLAFDPVEETTFGEMFYHANSAVDRYFTGWKGGQYLMDVDTEVCIGCFGECGENITSTHLKYWLISGSLIGESD